MRPKNVFSKTASDKEGTSKKHLKLMKCAKSANVSQFQNQWVRSQETLEVRDIKNILSITIKNTTNELLTNIRNRKKIVDMLETERNLLFSNNATTDFVLHLPKIHVNIIMYLIDKRVNLLSANEDGKTIMHLCPSYLTAEAYHKLVAFLIKRQLDHVFDLQCVSGSYPLHCAVKHLEIMEKTLVLLNNANRICAAHIDNNGKNIFDYAELHGRSTKFLVMLRKYGFRISTTSSQNSDNKSNCSSSPETSPPERFRSSLVQLVNTTECNSSVEASLLQDNILSNGDVESLEAKRQSEGKQRQSFELFRTVETRKHGERAILKALNRSGQSIPAETIVKNIEQRTGGIAAGKVLACGKKYRIKDLIMPEYIQEFDKILNKILDRTDYIDYFFTKDRNKMFVLVNDTIPKTPLFYIPRILTNSYILHVSIFKRLIPDVFVFNGMKRFQVSELAGEQCTASSETQRKEITNRFIILKSIEDWIAIRKNSAVPAHLVTYNPDENLYILKDSNGRSQVLQKYLTPMKSINISENKFVLQNLCRTSATSSVCVCDMPGMGKTTLLINIAQQISNMRHNCIPAFVELEKFITQVKRPLRCIFGDNSKCLINFLLYITASTKNAKILLKLIEKKIICIHLILDGLDCLQPEERSYIIHLVKQINFSFSAVKTIISSRLHLKHELESSLGVISYTMVPFLQEEQRKLMINIWMQQLSVHADKSEVQKLEYFAEFVLKNVINDDNILKFPLHCCRIADSYAGFANDYLRTGMRLSPQQDICDLFRKFISKSISSVVDRASTQVRLNNNVIISDVSLILKHIHIRHAWQFLFPGTKPHGLNNTKIIGQDNDVIFRIGILQAGNKGKSLTPEFVHPIFAECIVAQHCAKLLSTKPVSSVQFESNFELVLNTIFLVKNISGQSNLKNNTLAHFFNYFVNRQTLNNFANQETSFCKFWPPTKLFLILKKCCQQNYVNIFKVFSSILSNFSCDEINTYKEYITKLKSTSLISTAVRDSGKQLVQECFQLVKIIFGYDITASLNFTISTKTKKSLLKMAVQRNSYDIVEYLLTECSPTNQNLIYHCVKNSYKESSGFLQIRTEILQLLLAKCTNLLDECPNILISSEVHFDMLKILLDHEVDPYFGPKYHCSDAYYTCAIHAATYMSQSDYHSFIEYLLASYDAKLLFNREKSKKDPLNYIFFKLDLLPETIDLFFKLPGTDKQITDEDNENFLFYAVRGNKCQNLRNLVKHKIDYKHVSSQKQNLLHIAAECADSDIMEYLLSLGLDPNAHDTESNTPLHVSVISSDTTVAEMLVNYKANIYSPSKDGLTAFHLAAKDGNEKFLKYFLKIGMHINSTDNFGNVALHVCRDFKTMKFLVNAGGDISIKNNNNDTPAHLAFARFYLNEFNEITLFIIEHCEDGNIFSLQNKQGETVLHNLFRESSNLTKETLDTLFALPQIDIHRVNNEGTSCFKYVTQWCKEDWIMEYHTSNTAKLNTDLLTKHPFNHAVNIVSADESNNSKYPEKQTCDPEDIHTSSSELSSLTDNILEEAKRQSPKRKRRRYE